MVNLPKKNIKNKTYFNKDKRDSKQNNSKNIDNNIIYDNQIEELKIKLDEEKKKNQRLSDENKKLNDIICYLKSKISQIENYENKIKSLENVIQAINQDFQKYNSNIDIFKNKNDYSISSIKSVEEIITVNFVSKDCQDIGHYNLACRKTELFIRLEEKLINDFPVLRENELNFQVNTRKIKRYKTLEENNIKNNDIINLSLIES